MECRPNCGACCIAPSISSYIPGMPDGKKAGKSCIHLKQDLSCDIYYSIERPEVCINFAPSVEYCGKSPNEAMNILTDLEEKTSN